MTVLTDWQDAVVTALDAGLDGFTIKSGERDGVSRDRNIACVFGRDEPPDSNVQWIRPVLTVRAWIKSPKQVKTRSPRDSTVLQDLLEQIEVILQPMQVLPSIGGNGLYFNVTGNRIDRDDWGVELTLTGWAENPAVIA